MPAIYKDRYILSASSRWDGSNLFGTKTNQKGAPLWSVGLSWDITKENWINIDWIDYLKTRLTFGRAGNTNKLVSSLPTIVHLGQDNNTGLYSANIRSIGNPSLRWEQISTLNFGIDLRLWRGRISGNIDYYVKNAKDLIGAQILAPNTGIYTGSLAQNSNLTNYADLRTKGIDLQISSLNIEAPFHWRSTLLFNYVVNEVTKFAKQNLLSIGYYSLNPSPAVQGESRDMLYAIPWNGLSPDDGQQIIYIDGVASHDYAKYYNGLKKEDLVAVGASVPPFYGSLRNEVSYKGFGISALVSFKSGYFFRRESTDPTAILNSQLNYHMDYLDRWQKSGDELKSTVPSRTDIYNSYSAQIYNFSEPLVTKGDHIRLQDISISYTFPKKKSGIPNIRFYGYAKNLGIIWRSNRKGIDPDFFNNEFVAPKTYAIGLQVNF